MQIHSFDLEKDWIRIGRVAAKDIRRKNGHVSAGIWRSVAKEDRFAIKDLGSRNGTFVNGRPIVPGVEFGAEDIHSQFHGGTSRRFLPPRGRDITHLSMLMIGPRFFVLEKRPHGPIPMHQGSMQDPDRKRLWFMQGSPVTPFCC